MALRRIQADELRIGAAGAQAVGDLFLLLHREQDVGVGADRQRTRDADTCQAGSTVSAVETPVCGLAEAGRASARALSMAEPATGLSSTYSARSNQSIERLRYR